MMSIAKLLFSNIFCLLFILMVWPVTPLQAQTPFTPPGTVTLEMYQLVQATGGSTGILCQKDSEEIAKSYGCTADSTKPYPFNASTIRIGIDDTSGADNAQYAYAYLKDVVAQEFGLSGSNGVKPLAGIEAQAIASRTYTYQRIVEGYPVDNSAGYHVFLPYRFAMLTAAEQDRLMAALQPREYMTPGQDNPNTAVDESLYPLLAMYGTDNRARTSQGAPEGQTVGVLTNYLSAVDDPINERYGCWFGDDAQGQPMYGENGDFRCGTGNGGLSSKGASRWSFGHTSSYGPVVSTDSNYPHDSYGLGDFWSVRWEDARQILTHYYTNIQLRDATNSQHPALLPANRWVPLQITWNGAASQPTALCLGSPSVLVVAVIQNTGATTWPAGPAFSFSSAEFNGQQGQAADVFVPYPLEAVAPGGTYTATLTFSPRSNVANGTKIDYLFEMYKDSTPFSTLEPGNAWPGYLVPIEFVTCTPRAYLPTILADVAVAE